MTSKTDWLWLLAKDDESVIKGASLLLGEPKGNIIVREKHLLKGVEKEEFIYAVSKEMTFEEKMGW